MGKWEKWPKVSVGPRFDGKPGLAIGWPQGTGQVYRENQYVSVAARFFCGSISPRFPRTSGWIHTPINLAVILVILNDRGVF